MKRIIFAALVAAVFVAQLSTASIKNQPPGSGGGSSSGGGTVSDITSTGGTVTVTNPTGPTTNLETSALAGDITTSGTTATIAAGAVTLAKQAALAADSVPCNASNSSATQTACNPLAVANLLGAQLNVASAVALSTATPAYGTFTNDTSVTLTNGMIVMVYTVGSGQTCGTGTTSNGTGGAISGAPCAGLWVVQSGAPWIRPVNFPNGYTLLANCDLSVFIQQGTAYGGHTFYLTTTSAVTINTTNQVWHDGTIPSATSTALGLVKVTNSAGYGVFAASSQQTGITYKAGDCLQTPDTHGTVTDIGNANNTQGPCIVGDANGHPILDAFGDAPTVAGTGCSIASGSTDNRGAIVATGADTCTLTFGDAYTNAPFCATSGYSATVLPYIHTAPTTAAVAFSTAAAGTFSYVCF